MELIVERKLGLTEKEIRFKFKNRLAEIEEVAAPSNEEDFSKYDLLIKTITITSCLASALTYFILFEIDHLSGA